MATKRKTAPTKTISFRIDAAVYDKIIESAKAREMSLGEYVLASVDPMSELGRFIQMEQSGTLARNEIIQTGFVELITGLVNLKEQNGLDSESFSNAIKGSLSSLLHSKSTSNE